MTTEADPQPGVLTRAVVRASNLLGLTQPEMACVLDISIDAAADLNTGKSTLDPTSIGWKQAVQIIEMSQRLAPLLGDQTLLRTWMHSYNRALGDSPREVILRGDGLSNVLAYLRSASAADFP